MREPPDLTMPRFLYRRLVVAVIVILATLGAAALPSAAQMPQLKRPEETPEEKPKEQPKKKNVKGPRAVALVQFDSKGKAILIPVAILVDGKFYDAGEYKADPVPMALEPGTVYEAEQTGDSQGLFTISSALHSKNVGSAERWMGAGSFLPKGLEAPKSTHKAEDVPVGINGGGSSDEPPRLTRAGAAKQEASASSSSAPANSAGAGSSEKTAPASNSGSSPTSGSSGNSAGSSAPDTKTATPSSSDKSGDQGNTTAKGASTAGQPSTGQPPASQPSASQAPASQTNSGQDAAKTSSGNGSNEKPAQGDDAKQSPDNYYRPTLRRGKPTEPAPDDEDSGAKAVGTASTSTATAASGSTSARIVPAISDAGGPDPRSYTFYWKTGEEEERRTQMIAVAEDQVRAYIAALIKNQIPAKPPIKTSATVHKTSATKPVKLELENLQFRAFDVWGNNQPVMVLTADAHLASSEATTVPDSYSVALVTRTDIYGNLLKIFSNVTDKFHLDVTPELEFIDVVDADGDGRGELLFRETSDVGKGYLIYRATADRLWKLFDSLAE
jgi:hypothetical protein